MSGDTSMNYHFYPNACYVCKRFGEAVQLERCRRCDMIAYCSVRHANEHLKRHHMLCFAIQNVIASMAVKIDPDAYICKDDWNRLRITFMEKVNSVYNLNKYEKEILLFRRSCMVCNRQASLYDCTLCSCVSFCFDHEYRDHNCNKLRRLLSIDTDEMEDSADLNYIRHIDIEKQPFRFHDTNGMSHFFVSFVRHHILTGEPHRLSEFGIHSQQSTRPLTLLYAAHRTGYKFIKGSLVVHVIGSNNMEMESLRTWEIVFHLVPILKDVKILFCGPEVNPSLLGDFDALCDKCKSQGKKLNFVGHRKRYEDTLDFLNPDLIVGFNSKIHKSEVGYVDIVEYVQYDAMSANPWSNTIREIANFRKCPFILTCYDMTEAKSDMLAINQILGRENPATIVELNPYRSFRPYRDPETEGLVYQNSCLLIYLFP